jgi:ABC-type enterochelin transport system permease subunit
MTSTDILRIIIIIGSSSIMFYIIFLMLEKNKYKNLLVLFLSLVINILLRSLTVFLLIPLDPTEIIIVNNWNSVIVIQTLIMVAGISYYFSKAGNYE